MNALLAIDHGILLAIYHAASSTELTAAIAVFCATWLPLCLVCVVIVHELYVDDGGEMSIGDLFRIALPVVFVGIVATVMKVFIVKARPFADLDIAPLIRVSDPFGSFPSSHAAVFGALFGVMLARRSPIAWWLGVGALLVALGRVATGVHWPIDVISGLFLGFFLGFLAEKIFFCRSKEKTA